MALPAQAIDQLSREPVRTPGWSGNLLMFSATLLFLALGSYIGLVYGYAPYLSKQLSARDAEVKRTSAQIDPANQAKLIGFYSQLVNLDKILINHGYASNLFGWLEVNTHANVYFTKFDFVAENNKVTLAGVARSVKDITEQIQIFEKSDAVFDTGFSNVSAGSGGLWQFDAYVVYDPEFFTVRAAAPSVSAPIVTPASASSTVGTTSTRP